MKIRQLQSQIVETYLLTVGDATECEIRELREWVATGNSIYNNPYLLYSDSGCPMDFINGCRMGIEMDEDPSSFYGYMPDSADIVSPDNVGSVGPDSDLPF